MLLKPEEIREIVRQVPKRLAITPGYVPSAVFMIFFDRDNHTHLVYIRRTKQMRIHSGHMAFPGGKIDASDETSYATAVRETQEEIGVDVKEYSYLGDMGFFETLTSSYDAAAHLTWTGEQPKYEVNNKEVSEVVEIPLQALLQQFRRDLDFQNHEEVMYLNFHYTPEDASATANLWGLTARITHHFLQGLANSLQTRG